MFSQLDEIEKKYQKLAQDLRDASLNTNPIEYGRLAKEEAALRPLVDSYRLYQKKEQEVRENKKILKEEKDEAIREMAREEISSLEAELTHIKEGLRAALLPRDPRDDKNIYLEIRAGTGGEEAALFAADLFRMYGRYAEQQKWRVEIISTNPTGIGGLKEMIAMISGDRVYSRLKFESGVHRVQRVPRTEASGRIHTSAVTVAILPEADEVDVKVEDKDLRIDVFRAGGHGGQSVNTTDSAVRITHIPTGMVVICQDEKSQHKNKARALKVLRARLYDMRLTEQREAEAKARREQIGSGDRSEKIRTYNFPQNRVTDHRSGTTLKQLDTVLDGKLDLMIDPVVAFYQAEALKGPREET